MTGEPPRLQSRLDQALSILREMRHEAQTGTEWDDVPLWIAVPVLAETARLRAVVAAVRELCDAEDADRRPWRQWAGHVPVDALRRALAAAPTEGEGDARG